MTSLLAQAATSDGGYLLWGFVLVAVAFFLLFVELLVPSGGLIGILCGIAAIGSVVAFFKYDTTWGLVAALGYLLLGPIILVFVFKLWINSPLAKGMILGGHVGEDDEVPIGGPDQARRERLAQLQALIGAEGVAVTALRPVGVVKINDERVDALAESGVILSGTPVIVTDVYDNQIKVRAKG